MNNQNIISESDILAYVSFNDIQEFQKLLEYEPTIKWYNNVDKQLKSTLDNLIKEYSSGSQTQVQQKQSSPSVNVQIQVKAQKSSIKYKEIVPNEKEQILFNFLSEFIQEENVKVTMRCAGGWVRDKLLGVESHDIDIALDTMMGEEFVNQLKQYGNKKGEKMSGVGVIKANPDQSKHLETATCKVKGFDIDFVNLRGEEYAENSRIPTITFGTPKQDSERRDLTINSLFYNINENKLEDFCERGLSDLQKGICMTPLQPYKTFLDDPLRVLRTFRFASRYNFEIDDSLLQAINKLEIKKALVEKVSRERIRTEFEKMIRSSFPFQGVELIYRNNLWDVVFYIPVELQELSGNEKLAQEKHNMAFNFCQCIDKEFQNSAKYSQRISKCQQDIQFYIYLSSCILPYSNYQLMNSKKKMYCFSLYLTENALKLGKQDSDIICQICEWANYITNIIQENQSDKNILFMKLVKLIKECKEWWEISYFIAKTFSVVFSKNEKEEQKYEMLYRYIYQNHLEEIYNFKSLLNGQEIQEIYGKGKIVGIVSKNILFWQFQNYGKSKSELQDQIKEDRKLPEKDQFFLQINAY